MSNTFWTTRKRRIIVALMVNVLILVVYFIFVDLRYETNDDYSIANQVGTKGVLYVGYVNYYLCGIISFIQSNLFPTINIFVLSQICLSFLSFGVLTYVFLDSKRNWCLYGIGLLLLFVFAFDHYSLIQFTKTSGLLLVTGLIIIAHTFLTSNPKWIALVGIIWIVLGAALRYSTLKAIIGLSIVLVVALVLSDQNRKKNMKSVVGILISIMIAISISYLLNEASIVKNHSSEELKSYREYNKYRSAVLDYAIPDYADNKDFYDSYGLSENDLIVMKSNWLLDYDGAASLENLKAISKKQREEKQKIVMPATKKIIDTMRGSFKSMDRRAVHVFLILLILFFGTASLDRRWLWYALLVLGGGICAYLYLFYIGRAPYRATYIVDFAVASFFLYHMRNMPRRKWFKHIGESNKRYIPLVISLAVMMIAMQSIYIMEKSVPINNQQGYDANQLWLYMNEREDLLFVFDVGTATNYYQKTLDYYKNPLSAEPLLKGDNKTAFGGWSTMSPRRLKTHNKHGLNNLFLDIIDNENIIVVGDGSGDFYYRIEEYFNEQYGTDGLAVVFVPYGTVGGFSLWQVKYQEY